jgi:hypothetical protein
MQKTACFYIRHPASFMHGALFSSPARLVPGGVDDSFQAHGLSLIAHNPQFGGATVGVMRAPDA